MAKGQLRKTKEPRKPKKDAKEPAATGSPAPRPEPARVTKKPK